MQKNKSINLDVGADDAGIRLLNLPPEDLMNDYAPLEGGDEKKHGVRGQTYSSSNSSSTGSYAPSSTKESKYGAYGNSSSLSSSHSSSSSSTAQSIPTEETLLLRWSRLTAHRDDLIRNSQHRQHSRYEKDLENTLKWIAEVEAKLEELKDNNSGSKEQTGLSGSSSSSSSGEEDVKYGPGSYGRDPSQVPSSIPIDITDDKYPTSMVAWNNLQGVIREVNDPLERLEAKKRADKAEDQRTAAAGGVTRLWYKTTSFFSWACCGCLPTLCKSTFVLLTAGAVVGVGLYLKAQADSADAYQAPDFHPGDTTDDSIYALGGITSDLYNLVNNVWPLKDMARMGYMAAGGLGVVWTVEYFIYRFIHHQNEQTRQAGENTHQVTEAQTEVIRILVQEVKALKRELKQQQLKLTQQQARLDAQIRIIGGLTQEIKTLKQELKLERLKLARHEARFQRLERAVINFTRTSLPPLDDLEEKVVSSEVVSDGKEVGGLSNSVDEIKEGHTSDITAELLRRTAGRERTSSPGSPNSQSFVAGGGRGRGLRSGTGDTVVTSPNFGSR